MLPEGEDLLQQLSGELGLPEFLDDVTMLDDPNVLTGGIYDSLMEDLPSETDIWLNDISNPGMTNGSSVNAFPPSPSNSDSSATSSCDNVLMAPGEVRLGDSSGLGLKCEVTPPVSPPAANIINSSGASIVSVPDLANVKLPIPKIQKPSKFYTIVNNI